MPQLGVGDIWEVKYFNVDAEQIGLNVRHWRVASVTGTAPADTDLANSMATAFLPLYNALCSANGAFFGVQVQRLTPGGKTVPVHSSGAPVAHSRAGAGLPRQSAGIISLRTNLVGRANRGRVYVPFPAQVDSQGLGTPTPGYVTSLGNLATAFVNQHSSVGTGGSAVLRDVIFHRALQTSTDVTAAVAESLWATQRRRGSFGRPNANPL